MRNLTRSHLLLIALISGFIGLSPHALSDSGPDFGGWEPGEAHDTERRIATWVTRGAQQETLHRIIRQTDGLFGEGPGSWVYENVQVGESLLAAGDDALAAGNKSEARGLYQSAAAHFGSGKYPFIHSPSARLAYSKHNSAYYQYIELTDLNVDRLKIPFEGKEIIGNLYWPSGEQASSPYPLVVVSGGIDTWKNELMPSINAMLAQGFAVFAMDMPGTGESQWRLGPSAERVYAAAIDYLKKLPYIDEQRMAVSLRSFGGHFAVKLALTNPAIKAAVNVGGPVTFGDGELWPLPPFMLRTVGAGFGIDQQLFDENEAGRNLLALKVAELSLRKQGLLVPTKTQAKLLTINGELDQLVPVEEIITLTKAGIQQEIWLYLDDGHCAGKNSHEYIPASAAWLKMQLNDL